MQTDGGCSHCGGCQWQRQRCHHGMGWVPILQQQWQFKRMGLMQSSGSVHTEGGGNGNIYMYLDVSCHCCPLQCEHSRRKKNSVAVAVTQCEQTFNATMTLAILLRLKTMELLPFFSDFIVLNENTIVSVIEFSRNTQSWQC